MKASELRIGNYLQDFGGNVAQVIHLTKDKIILESPIPLTEEWLLKFGFEIFPWGWVKKADNDFGLRLNLKSFSYDVSGNNPVKLKYVHQLQNLYFALTGEELTIK